MKARQVSVVTPSARERASAARPAILIVVLIILVLVAIGLLPEGGMELHAPWGPAVTRPGGRGTAPLAQVLSNRGASVEEVSFDKAVTVDENTTLVVVFPSRLTSAQIQQIETRANVVYIGLEEEYGTEPYLDGLSSQRAGTYDTLTAPGMLLRDRCPSSRAHVYQVCALRLLRRLGALFYHQRGGFRVRRTRRARPLPRDHSGFGARAQPSDRGPWKRGARDQRDWAHAQGRLARCFLLQRPRLTSR